ncbi:MAG: Cu(I)-responsive transcriptional regulator [Oligoflexus sp.]
MNISQAAKAAGMNAKNVRHYEAQGIIPKASRTDKGYRLYSESDVHILRFVRQARSLGFSLTDIKKLLGLWRNKRRKSEDVKRIALQHIQELETKISELQAIKQALVNLSQHCHGDQRPDCPILDDLATLR